MADRAIVLDCFLDTMLLLKENALKARQESMQNRQDGFKMGVSFGYYEVLHLFEEQAQAFGVSLGDLNLRDINPDIDLLGLKKA